MMVLKVLMFLAALVAVILYIYGMAGTSKTVVQDAFTTLDGLNAYLTRAVGYINDLTVAVGNVSVVIDEFQNIVNVDVDVGGFRSNTGVVKTFLTSITPPATLATTVGTLGTAINTALPAALTSLGTVLTNVGAGSPMATALANVGGAESAAAAMTGALSDLDTKIAALPAAGGAHPGTSNAAVAAFSASLSAAAPGMTGGWATTLDAISAAVDALTGMQGATNNPLTIANAQLSAVTALVSQLTATDIPNFSADMTPLVSQYATVSPALTWIANKLVSINATVLELTPDMQAALTSVTQASASLDAFFSSTPSPTALSTTLTTTGSSLSMPGATPGLAAGLSAQGTALDGAQFNGAPGGSDGAVLKAWVTSAKADITAAVGAFNSAVSARDTYFATPSDANYNAMVSAANTYRGAAATTTVRSTLAQQDHSPTAASNYATAAPLIAAAGTAAATGLGPYVASAAAAAAGVPSMGSYSTTLAAVALPATTIFDAPQAALDAIESAVINGGNTAKAQVASTLSSFSGATGQLQTQVLGQLDRVQAQVEPTALAADGIRYKASMALYALPIVVILVLAFCSLLVNYHFGVNLSTLLLLVLLVLGFLLAAVLAVVLAILGDVCPAVEPLLLTKVPPNLAPIANYYFAGQGTDVKSALNATGIVNVDAVLAQVEAGKQDVLGGVTGAYIFRAGPTAVLVHLNATVDDAVTAVNSLITAVGRDQVLPLYLSLKGLLCCTVPDSFTSMWTALTIGGILAWLLVLMTFIYIGKLDSLPRLDCCGCSCHTRSKYAGTVCPGPRPQHGLGDEPRAWGSGNLGPAHPAGAHQPPGDIEAGGRKGRPPAPVPLEQAGWDEDHGVVAQLVVRTPGGSQTTPAQGKE